MADQKAEDEPGVDVTKIGINGVNLVKNPLKLSDSELVLAQNAEPYRDRGVAGIRKRPAWRQLNSLPTAAIRGAVGLDFATIGNGDDLTGASGVGVYGAIYLSLDGNTSWKVSVNGGVTWATVTLTNTIAQAPRAVV